MLEVGYVTDIEGNLGYFNNWVTQSKILRFGGDGMLEFVHESAYFVYGGAPKRFWLQFKRASMCPPVRPRIAQATRPIVATDRSGSCGCCST